MSVRQSTRWIAALLCALVGVGAISSVIHAAEPVRIRFWHNKAGREGDAIRAIVDKYNRLNRGVVVEQQFVGSGSELLQKTMAALVAKDPPDVIYGYGVWAAPFYEDGVVVTVDELSRRFGGWDPNYYYPPLVRAQTYKGVVVGVPYGTATKVFYYNPPLVQKSGYEQPPATWEDFEQFALKLKSARNAGTVIWAKGEDWFYLLLYQLGGSILADDTDPESDPGVDGPAAVKALSVLKAWTASGVAHLVATRSEADQEFRAGLVATTMGGEFDLGEYKAGGLPVGVVPFPTVRPQDQPTTRAGGDAFYFFRTGAARERAAWDFVLWLSRPEIYLEWAVIGSSRLPISPRIEELPGYRDWVQKNPELSVMTRTLRGAFSAPQTRYYNAYVTYIVDAIESALYGKQTVEAALRGAAQRMKDFRASQRQP